MPRASVLAAITLVAVALVLGLPAAASAATPDLTTWDAYSTGTTTATVEGVVNPNGESTQYFAKYALATSDWCTSGGTLGTPTATTATDLGFIDTSFHFVTVDLTTGLTADLNYCAQLVATNASGERDGGQVTWTEGRPTADTFDVVATGESTATVDGDVNQAGQTTTYLVQYDLASSDWCTSGGTSGPPAHTTTPTAGGLPGTPDGTFHDVSVDLTGLAASTSYCAQIAATNAAGTAEGGQVSWSQPTPPPQATLKVQVFGSGTVTSSPAGINCSSGTCSKAFDVGTQVTLTASGGTFSGWGAFIGLGCPPPGSTVPTCTFTLNSDETVSAFFSAPPPPPPTGDVVVQLDGSGSGTVISSPAGIDCGSTCSHSFTAGSPVTLTATPAPGSTFAGWSGAGCADTGACRPLPPPNGFVTVTATFTENPPPPTPPRCKVPKVMGRKLAAAKAAIRHGHCGVGKITRAFSTKVKRGRVISTKPRAGSKHPRGTKVKLTVSKGRKP